MTQRASYLHFPEQDLNKGGTRLPWETDLQDWVLGLQDWVFKK